MHDKKLMAKKEMLRSLKKEMMGLMGDDRGDLKDQLGKKLMKVTVASDSSEGLKKGLSKAEEILKKRSMDSMEESDEYSDKMDKEDESLDKYEESDKEMQDESEDCDEMSEDELKDKIAKLQEKLSKKSK